MSEETKLIIPGLVFDGIKALRRYEPSLATKLSWYHLDLLTKPLRQRIKELETNVAFFRSCALSGEVPREDSQPYPGPHAAEVIGGTDYTGE